jgi:hypothetical protein
VKVRKTQKKEENWWEGRGRRRQTPLLKVELEKGRKEKGTKRKVKERGIRMCYRSFFGNN